MGPGKISKKGVLWLLLFCFCFSFSNGTLRKFTCHPYAGATLISSVVPILVNVLLN